MRRRFLVLLATVLAACAPYSPMPLIALGDDQSPPPDVLLLGEQHDAPDHQETHRQVIEALAAPGRLATVALEMAEQGRSTADLPRDADEAAVRGALGWDEAAWPWQAYRPAIMAAVRAGVPVVGANLPRLQLRPAMGDSTLDTALDGAAFQAQQQAIRRGHCELLPESQIAPMARVQIARDRAMAQTLAQAVRPGKTVVLLAGAGHVDPALGVPRHLPAALRVQATPLPARPPAKDYCAELKQQFRARPKS